REVGNGGYSQFFYNSSVEYAPIIVDSLRAIGCNEIADLTQKAIELLGVDSLDPEVIEERMDPDDDALEDALGELDDIYFNEVEDVPSYALFDYIKQNRKSIKLA
ncbi:MAG: DMP19 family protein, partial [bacterium]